MGVPIPDRTIFKGPFKPMRFEATVEDCVVSHGEIPKDLTGGFYRNGPTFKRQPRSGHAGLLNMDGMVQALVFDNGRADFRNRWIRTPKYLLEERHGTAMFEFSDGQWDDWRNYGWGEVKRDAYNRGIPQGTNNINTFPFNGEVIATGEVGGPPIALDPITLESRGIVEWSSQLGHGIHAPAGTPNGNAEGIMRPGDDPDAMFSAHPKWDSDTGDLIGVTYQNQPPYVTVHVIAREGTVRSRRLDAPYKTVQHDLWLTREWVVVPFQPFYVDTQRIEQGMTMIDWDRDQPIVLALVPRDDLENGAVRYIDTGLEPQYMMHTLSCNVEDNMLTLDAPIFNVPPYPMESTNKGGEDVALFFSVAKSVLSRWAVDLDTGKTTSEQLNDRPAELPKVDERFFGKGYRYGYTIAGDPKGNGMKMKDLAIYDVKTGTDQVYRIRHDTPAAVLEAVFAPRTPDSPEGDGYLLVPVSRWAENISEFQIFDTDDITDGPVCRIDIPFHMGWTPHGHWMDFR
jgi:carotenoid cleavage dioxygenase-like enzyme